MIEGYFMIGVYFVILILGVCDRVHFVVGGILCDKGYTL